MKATTMQAPSQPGVRTECRAEARSADGFQLKKLLVPIDFSECSRKALRYALPLAKEHQAEITLVYVVPRPDYVPGPELAPELALMESQMEGQSRKDLAALALAELDDKVPYKTLIQGGLPAIEIVEIAKRLETDLIVISTHGRTGLKHALLGSVAGHVVRRAPCPVLVVREHEHDFIPDRNPERGAKS